jgi:hypothetical protein
LGKVEIEGALGDEDLPRRILEVQCCERSDPGVGDVGLAGFTGGADVNGAESSVSPCALWMFMALAQGGNLPRIEVNVPRPVSMMRLQPRAGKKWMAGMELSTAREMGLLGSEGPKDCGLSCDACHRHNHTGTPPEVPGA